MPAARLFAASLAVLSPMLARGGVPSDQDPSTRPPAAAEAQPEPAAPPKARLLAIAEGPLGVNLTLNVIGRVFKGGRTYDATPRSTWKNVTGPWEYDPNSFQTNQFSHPYQGSLFMTASRSLGLGFWESFAHAFLGSLVWETAMEIHKPSLNDQITTTIAGAFLGEVLFRLSSLLLEDGGDSPGLWRELGAAATAPMGGLNRALFGDRYRDRRLAGFPTYKELVVALSLGGRDRNGGARREIDPGNVVLRGRFVHGLPTEQGWRFRRPFDHFDAAMGIVVDRDALTHRSGMNLLIRGLLFADAYGEGASSGLWGLWGAYDTIAAGDLRASSSAVALGTVAQFAPAPGLRIVGTVYAGVGFGAGGKNVVVVDRRDYHFGAQVLGVGEIKVLWADRLRLRLASRQYVTGDTLSPEADGFEDVTYGMADLTARLYGRHSLGLEISGVRRHARYNEVPDTKQQVAQFGVTYAYSSELDPGAGIAIAR